MSAVQTAKVVAFLFAAYRHQTGKWSDSEAAETAKVYIDALLDIPSDKLADMVRRVIATHKFLPSIADLRAEVSKIDNSSIDAGDAWAEVLAAVSRYGRYRTPKFSTQIITKAVAAVGWQAICDSEMISVERAHFRKAYEESLAFIDRVGQLGESLLTEHERQRLQGLHDQQGKKLRGGGPVSLKAIMGGKE